MTREYRLISTDLKIKNKIDVNYNFEFGMGCLG